MNVLDLQTLPVRDDGARRSGLGPQSNLSVAQCPTTLHAVFGHDRDAAADEEAG
jgi:hypothetical protein